MSEPQDTDTRLVAALWQVVAARGWSGVTMARIVAASGVPAAELRRRCPGPLALLRLHTRVTDQLVLAGTIPGQPVSPRDRLFDVIMRRIDALQPHRAGITRLLDELARDPLPALPLLAEMPRAMAWMLEAAEIDTAGLPGLARAKGLTAVWLATLRAWARDESPDLGATMAALDRALDQAERVARSLGLDADARAGGPRHPI